MFLQSKGNFKEVTLFSGADIRDDARGFAYFDFDQDGWLDIGVTSPTEPRFRIFRNNLGEIQSSESGSVFLRLVGGNETANPDNEYSAREAYGASVVVTTGDTKRKFQYSCWEGLSSQNSPWMHIGLGSAKQIDKVEIMWPSGKESTHTNLAASSRVTIRERDDKAAVDTN